MKQKILTLGWFGRESPPAQARPGRGAHGPGAGAADAAGAGLRRPRPPSSTPRGAWSSESPRVRKPRIRRYRDGRVLWQVRRRRGVVLVLGVSPVRSRGPRRGQDAGSARALRPGSPGRSRSRRGPAILVSDVPKGMSVF